MPVAVTPFMAGCGADIDGVDIREPLRIEDRDTIRAAWLKHLVLRFRGQPLTDEQHMAFTRQFGELEYNPARLIEEEYGVSVNAYGQPGRLPPEIAVVSNIIENGRRIGGLGDGDAFWHTDSSFVSAPPAASLLRAIEVPPHSAGGATYFMNCYSAYETLPVTLKELIEGLTAIHVAGPMIRRLRRLEAGGLRRWAERAGGNDSADLLGAHHPLVRTHPETGRKALYLGRRVTHSGGRKASLVGRRINARVVGLSSDDSETLLDVLWEHAMQEQFTWKQEWQVGDLVWWDNRCAMHRRDSFDPTTRRLLHRTQLRGLRPC